MDKQQNDFMLMRHVVSNVVSQYKELRKCIGWKDSGKSATILRLANPFLTGYFTIAVAGKMSAGKSTFINSLIGENLLPTGHFQTTSCITWVISSEKRYMEVTFADGKTKTFTENLADELLKLVAVPPKFQSLPINHINSLIRHGDNIAIILGRKDGIEKMTHTGAV
jgi:GTP-binding protein EngB required for normal cell division